MKKTISFLLSIVMLLGFAACSKSKEKVDIPSIPPERGTVTDKTYTNKYLDLSFTASSDSWVFATTEELAIGCNIEPEKFASGDFAKLLEENPTVYDVIAQTETDKIAILVGIENPKLSGVSSSSSAADFVNKSLDSFIASIDIETNTYRVSDPETINLCGHEYVKRTLTVETDTDSAIQTYYARSMGDYLCIIVTAHTEDTTVEQIEELFS